MAKLLRSTRYLQHKMDLQANVDIYRKTTCRYCNSLLEAPFLELGAMPLANSFLSPEQADDIEFTCPLSLTRCPRCGLVQLTHVVPSELMFSNYLYVSSTTETFRKHFSDYAAAVRKQLLKEERTIAVDIGSNDGLLLSCYQNEKMTAIGVEPARNLSESANQKGLLTLNRFFNSSCVDEILTKFGRADVVSANNVFAHIDDIHDVCRNVARLMSEEGIFVLEFPYLVVMVENMLFDMIYHEHLSYISVTALNFLLNQHRLEIFAIEPVASHGGSLRVFIQKKNGRHRKSNEVAKMLNDESTNGYCSPSTYRQFAERVYQVKAELVRCIGDIKSKGKTVAGYGAAAKANTIINLCGFGKSQIDYIVDDNPLKQGKLSPGAKIPIVARTSFHEDTPDYVIIFAWNFADEIIRKSRILQEKGVKFIIPLPHPKVI